MKVIKFINQNGGLAMALQVYINFRGNCKEALSFYKDVFGSEEPQIMTFGQAPANPEYKTPDEAKELVMHATIDIKGNIVMCSDTPPWMPFTLGDNISLMLGFSDESELKNVYEKLSQGANVKMPLQKTFWSDAYANLTDKFGVGWQLSLVK